jgi:hypothetical protein
MPAALLDQTRSNLPPKLEVPVGLAETVAVLLEDAVSQLEILDDIASRVRINHFCRQTSFN